MDNSRDEDTIAKLKKRINSNNSNSTLTFVMGKSGIGKSTVLPFRLVAEEEAEDEEGEASLSTPKLLISLPTQMATDRNRLQLATVFHDIPVAVRDRLGLVNEDGVATAQDPLITCIANRHLYQWMYKSHRSVRTSELWGYNIVVIDDFHNENLIHDLLQQLIPEVMAGRDEAKRPIHFILQSSSPPNAVTRQQLIKYNNRNDSQTESENGSEIESGVLDSAIFEIKENVWHVIKTYSIKKEFESVKPIGTRQSVVFEKISKIVRKAHFEGLLADLSVLVFVSSMTEALSMRASWQTAKERPDNLQMQAYAIYDDRPLVVGDKGPNIIFATEILSNGIVLPKIQHVIVTGFKSVPVFDRKLGQQIPREVSLTRQEVDQQCHRVGRTENGTCWFLFTRERYEAMPKTMVSTTIIGDCIDYAIHILNLGLPGIPLRTYAGFDYVADPPTDVLANAMTRLLVNHCIEVDRDLNAEQFPFKVRSSLSKILVETFPTIDLRAANIVAQMSATESIQHKVMTINLACVMSIGRLCRRESEKNRKLSTQAEVDLVNDSDWPQVQRLGDPWKDLIQFERIRSHGRRHAAEKWNQLWVLQGGRFEQMEKLRQKILAVLKISNVVNVFPATEAQAVMLQDQVLDAYKYELVKVTKVKAHGATQADEIKGIHVASGVEISLRTHTVLSLTEAEIRAGLYVVFVDQLQADKSEYEYVATNIFRVRRESVQREFGSDLQAMKDCLGHHNHIQSK